MQMIDVLKRLAQLDAKNPNVVKEGQVQECGPMGMMDGIPGISPAGLDKPSVPANFNISASAASGNEVADMMSQILTLAGMKKVGADDLGAEPQGAMVTAEPVASVGAMAAEPMPTAADSMRSVLDKLNPETGDDEGGELGPFQHDSEKPETGNDAGDDQPADDEEETDEGNAYGQAVQNTAPGEEIKINGKGTGDIKKAEEGQYDNSPADAEPKEPFAANQFANQENQAGGGETSNGEKRQSNLPTATFENLMKEYKAFIGESADEEMDEAADDEDMDEGIEDRLKDLDPKNPVNIPAYQRKAKSGDSAQAAKKESVEETADILKLAGLK
jgi:hypothetical protein